MCSAMCNILFCFVTVYHMFNMFLAYVLDDLPIVMFVVQVGDGTTTVVLLAGEFLKEAKPFIEDGVHPQNLIRSYRTASYLVYDMNFFSQVRLHSSCSILNITNNVIGNREDQRTSCQHRGKKSGRKEKLTRQMCCYDTLFKTHWWRKGVLCINGRRRCNCNWD